MDGAAVTQWVVGLGYGNLRLSQAKTLAWIVSATLHVRQLTLAALAGETQAKTTFKHKLKRIDRFLSNSRIQPTQAYQPFIQRLLKRRKKRLIVACDWTHFRQLNTLALVAVFKGRAVPLLWKTVPEYGLFKRQTCIEKEMLTDLKRLLPEGLSVLVLADRGFGKTDLARHCQELKLDYLIRCKPNVFIRCSRHEGLLSRYRVQPGQCHALRDVSFRKNHPVCQQVVVCQKRKKKAEIWYLMTSLKEAAARLVDYYAHRMSVEECFRDQKSRRSGFSLRDTQVRNAERFDRLLLILAIALLLLSGLGLYAREHYCPSCWSSNKREREQSVLTIARRMLNHLQVTPEQAVKKLIKALEQVAPNWG